jgi:ribonuclease H / adenosylcobalamin/alpha-ribazole phosphatase
VDDRKRTTRFFLVRHGETAENQRMRYVGTTDARLTDSGIQQARSVAEALSRFPVASIVSSPMRRAADTAARIQEACGAELRLDSRLAEGSFGRWEGRARDEVLNLGEAEAAQLARWESDSSIAPPGGESIESVQKRALNLVEELTDRYAGTSVVLVSHVGPIKALFAAVLDVPLLATRRLFLDPATISIIDWGPHPLLRLFNSHAHLGWAHPRWGE